MRSRMMRQFEVKAAEDQGPLGLSMGQFLLGHEVLKVAVVGPYLGLVFCTFKVVSEVHKGCYNCQEFFVMHNVVSFGGVHGLGEVCHGVLSVEFIGLFQDRAKGEVACIRDQAEGPIVVWEHQDRGGCERIYQHAK